LEIKFSIRIAIWILTSVYNNGEKLKINLVEQFWDPLYLGTTNFVKASGGLYKLNATSTRFNINDTIETLAYEMFIESWTSNVSYERFFNSCAPAYCTYKVYYRFDALELLTTFLSVYVGLSLGIHIMVPYAVKMIKKIRNRFRVMPVQ
jgi:hypothetical protein